MKTLLRDIRTGLYFCGCREWTSNPSRALSFKLINRAIRCAEKMGLRGVELVISSPKQAKLTTLPVGMLDNPGHSYGRRRD
jgi:hypothetical protein